MNYLKITAVILLVGVTYSFAQSSETKEKLKNLKGDVTKITVETTEGKVELTGEDAESAFAKLKSSKSNSFVFIHDGDEDDLGKKIFVNVNIDDKDGDKIVVIKEKVEGKETVEEYKGEEAEKFIKEHGGKNGDIRVIVADDDDDLVWVTKNDSGSVEQNVNVEVENGVKKITVTTVKNGRKNVEVYEGEEAEKYLEKMEKDGSQVFIDDDGNKTIIKKKIIIIEENDHDSNDNDDNNKK